MLADTVGFIHRLPHMLVEAFKATLEEVRTADLLLHVVDASSPLAVERMEIVDRVLEEIGAGAASRIVVMNKIDLVSADGMRLGVAADTVAISALRSRGLDELLGAMARWFSAWREEVTVMLPAGRGDLVAMARRDGEVLGEEYNNGTVALWARVSAPVAGRLRKAAIV
jgi:GTP-binding protein HflX